MINNHEYTYFNNNDSFARLINHEYSLNIEHEIEKYLDIIRASVEFKLKKKLMMVYQRAKDIQSATPAAAQMVEGQENLQRDKTLKIST